MFISAGDIAMRSKVGRNSHQHRRQADKAWASQRVGHRGHLHREATNATMSKPGIKLPTGSATRRDSSRPGRTNAITIPIMPYQFPRRAVSCFDNPPRLKINNALAAMYAIVIRLVVISETSPTFD
jgi:hypothetical protein